MFPLRHPPGGGDVNSAATPSAAAYSKTFYNTFPANSSTPNLHPSGGGPLQQQQPPTTPSSFYSYHNATNSHQQQPSPSTASTHLPNLSSGGGGGASGGAQFTLIANVPYDTVRQDLVVEFRKYGRVELAMVVCDEASRHPHKEWTSTAGYAFVRFSQRQEAAAAIQAASLGLITIRGTRVRADWARKDSYAKRGRVSPTQGAPLLGPLGVPDGIEQLRQLSLMEQTSTGTSTPTQQVTAQSGTPSAASGMSGTLRSLPHPISRRSMSHLSDSYGGTNRGSSHQLLRTNTDSLKFLYGGRGGAVDDSPMPQTGGAATQRCGDTNRGILQALQDAFGHILSTRMPPDESRGLHTAPTTPQLYCHDDSNKSKSGTAGGVFAGPSFLPRNQSVSFVGGGDDDDDTPGPPRQGMATPQRPLYHQSSFDGFLGSSAPPLFMSGHSAATPGSGTIPSAPPLLPKECWMVGDSPRSSSATGGGSSDAVAPETSASFRCFPLSARCGGRATPTGGSPLRNSFDDVLSPVSRGLLAQALSDVAFGAFDGSASPTEALTQTTVCSSSAAIRRTPPEELLQRAIDQLPSSSKIEAGPSDSPVAQAGDEVSSKVTTDQRTPLMTGGSSLHSGISASSKESSFYPLSAGWTDDEESKRCDYEGSEPAWTTTTGGGAPPVVGS